MRTLGVVAAFALLPAAVGAQQLAERVDAAPPDAAVRFTYDAKPGLCGDGDNILFDRGRGEGTVSILRNRGRGSAGRRSIDELRERCDEGPVRITLERSARRITDVDVEVGGEPERIADAVDLGHIAAEPAVVYLLDTVVPRSADSVARHAIFAATLADGVEPWPRLLRIARDRDIDRDVRRHAVFWVGQAAAERATDGLVEIAADDSEEMEVRKHALFALSQRRDERSFEALLEVARDGADPELRKHAIFWLGQTEDPRALALFEEILVRR